MLRVYMECMLQVLGESKRSQGCSALYADACQQIADAIRVRCNQLSVLCGRLATTGLGETSEHVTCFAALSAYTWLDGHLVGLSGSVLRLKPGPIRDGVCQASPRGARRGVGRSVPPLAQAFPALRRLRHIRKSLAEVQRFRGLGGTLAVPPTDDVQVPPPVVSGATDAMERTVPNRR